METLNNSPKIYANKKYEVSGEQLLELNCKMDELRRMLICWEEGLAGALMLIIESPESMVPFTAKVGLVAQEMGSAVNGVQMERFSRVAYALAEKQIEEEQR